MSNARFERFAPITKINAETREVEGILAVEEPDHTGEIMDYAGSKPLFQAWSDSFKLATGGKSAGNLRAMHGGVCAGKFTSVGFDDAAKAIPVVAKVVDDAEWAKVEEGCYTGFSIGGRYTKVWKDGDLKRYIADPVEGSLVDKPCIPGATFAVVRADGSTELRKFRAPAPFAAAVEALEKKGAEPKDAQATCAGAIKWVETTLEKGLTEAIAAGDAAIESVKTMAVELLGLAGKPDTWSIEDLMTAIRRISGAQYYSAADMAEGGIQMSDKPDVTKAAEPKPGTGDPTPADKTTEPAATKPADTPADAAKLDGALLTKLNETLESIGKALADQAGEQKAIKEDLGKVVETATSSALEKAKAQLDDVKQSIEKRLDALEAQPVRPGRPAEKRVGLTTGELPLAGDFDKVEGLIKTLEAAGTNPQAVKELRMTLSQMAIRPLR